MADSKDVLFEVMTPLGFRVRVTQGYGDTGFLITTYPTDAIKEGVQVWHK